MSDKRRDALIDTLADHVLAEGLSASSLRPLAKAAGTSDRMLLYYFKDKAEVIAAVLERIAARLVAMLDQHRAPTPQPIDVLRRTLLATFFHAALYRGVGAQIGRGFLAWGIVQIDAPTPEARALDAARLMGSIEGALVLRSLGLEEITADAFGTD
mgnify:CR=1 FL=1